MVVGLFCMAVITILVAAGWLLLAACAWAACLPPSYAELAGSSDVAPPHITPAGACLPPARHRHVAVVDTAVAQQQLAAQAQVVR